MTGNGAKNRHKFSAKDLAKTEAAVRATWAWRRASKANAGLDELARRVPPTLRIPGGYFSGGPSRFQFRGTPDCNESAALHTATAWIPHCR